MSLIDPFQRSITYLRISVTDRCDFRCVYCMNEEMTFLPRSQVLSLEELADIAAAFTELGVKKIRITGGEPLIRRDVLSLFRNLGELPLDELTLTTNGSHLERYAQDLRAAGVRRLNISLDSLQEDRFRDLTRVGDLQKVLRGIEAARAAGFEKIKLNSVVLKNRNADEVVDLVRFALARQLDISFIEEMPLGSVTDHIRREEFCSSQELRDLLGAEFSLAPLEETTGGPSRYWQVNDSKTRVGFISPHSENFCASCNRVRLTAEGRLLLCLGNEHSVDLKAVVRRHPGDREKLKAAIVDAIRIKPERHYFTHDDEPQIVRLMNTTGG
ncbi:GTP 3',8-cyclase MoaA [Gilvimarinus sp. F26214L]|uniref:GTP 3',8-cyclase MoaA n=1 Tax=Gilvimarinus sp. DZF01 TaxID=3461371 RepID=UPI0040454E0F